MAKPSTSRSTSAAAEVRPPDVLEQLAPPPVIDRYPVIIGQNLSLQYAASASRNSITGYRREWVDLLDELIQREPHGYAVLAQRVLSVAGGRLEVAPAELEQDHPDTALAEEAARLVERQIKALPDLQASLAHLLWALYYGVAAHEILWDRVDGEWRATRLSPIHSRRLAYPDPGTWDLHVWDQGAVRFDVYNAPTNVVFGLKVKDYPGKFISHVSCVRGDYPTREGLGFELCDWFLLKRMAARGAGTYLERFGRPWATAAYATGEDGRKRPATTDDINTAAASMAALGAGSLSSYVHPDNIVPALLNPDSGGGKSKLTYGDFITLINGEISKAVLGQTLTTEQGGGGSRALGEVHQRGKLELARFDAVTLGETLRRDLVAWIVRLNLPAALHVLPRITIHVDEEPDPAAIVEVAAKAAAIGMPLDADDLARRLGLKLVDRPEGAKGARRLSPVSPVDPSTLDGSAQATEPAPDEAHDNDPPEDGDPPLPN